MADRAEIVESGRVVGLQALHWKLVTAGVFVLIVLVSAVFGWSVSVIPGFAAATGYGLFAVLRKTLQHVFAAAHLRRVRRAVRRRLVEAFCRAYPRLTGQACRAGAGAAFFDEFAARLTDLASSAGGGLGPEDAWRRIVAASFASAPPVGLVVPYYRTRDEDMRRLVDSLVRQTYPGEIRVKICLNEADEDGSRRRWLTRLVAPHAAHPRVRFEVIHEPRPGKRQAMFAGFEALLDEGVAELVMNVDSDTFAHPDAVSNAVAFQQECPGIHCHTGEVRVENPDANLLTRLTSQRYYLAFNHERAAQSFFDEVTCMSGPFFCVTAAHLREIVRPWLEQRFLGARCTYGDDRHIATLTLRLGRGCGYNPESIVWTEAPVRFGEWLRQQTRWSRSAKRETVVTLPWIGQLRWWTILEIAYQTAFPFVLLAVLVALGVRVARVSLFQASVAAGAAILFPYVVIVTAFSILYNCADCAIRKRDAKYLLYPLYIILHFGVLEWLNFYAWFTLDDTKWLTK